MFSGLHVRLYKPGAAAYSPPVTCVNSVLHNVSHQILENNLHTPSYGLQLNLCNPLKQDCELQYDNVASGVSVPCPVELFPIWTHPVQTRWLCSSDGYLDGCYDTTQALSTSVDNPRWRPSTLSTSVGSLHCRPSTLSTSVGSPRCRPSACSR